MINWSRRNSLYEDAFPPFARVKNAPRHIEKWAERIVKAETNGFRRTSEIFKCWNLLDDDDELRKIEEIFNFSASRMWKWLIRWKCEIINGLKSDKDRRNSRNSERIWDVNVSTRNRKWQNFTRKRSKLKLLVKSVRNWWGENSGLNCFPQLYTAKSRSMEIMETEKLENLSCCTRCSGKWRV